MIGRLMANANPFSSNITTSQKAEHFQELVNQQLAEQEAVRQKELEIQQQAETLQKAAEIEKYEETLAEEKQEEVIQQWQTIQALSKQALQEQPEEEQEEKEQTEHDVQKQLEELSQQLKEM